MLSGEVLLGQYITLELLRKFRQLCFGGLTSSQPSPAVSSRFYSMANAEFIYFTVEWRWSTVGYHPRRNAKSKLLIGYYKSIDARVMCCLLSYSYTLKMMGKWK